MDDTFGFKIKAIRYKLEKLHSFFVLLPQNSLSFLYFNVSLCLSYIKTKYRVQTPLHLILFKLI
jgi:hypothetical protein